jgi:hypothetical protein
MAFRDGVWEYPLFARGIGLDSNRGVHIIAYATPISAAAVYPAAYNNLVVCVVDRFRADSLHYSKTGTESFSAGEYFWNWSCRMFR